MVGFQSDGHRTAKKGCRGNSPMFSVVHGVGPQCTYASEHTFSKLGGQGGYSRVEVLLGSSVQWYLTPLSIIAISANSSACTFTVRRVSTG